MNKNTCFGMFVTGIWFVLLGCCCAAGAASTQASQPAAQRVALVEKDGFVVSQLNNGLTVVVQEDHSTELVSLNFFVRTGSIYERPGGAGLSHLLEHLVMGGTTSRHTEQQLGCVIGISLVPVAGCTERKCMGLMWMLLQRHDGKKRYPYQHIKE